MGAPITDAEQQALIIAQIGDEQSVLATNIPQLWQQWSGKALVHPELQVLYVTRDCIRLVLPNYRNKAVTMLTSIQAEIVRVEAKARSTRGGAIAQLTTVTGSVPPDSPNAPAPSPYIDANDPMYRGDPYVSSNPPFGGPSTDIAESEALV